MSLTSDHLKIFHVVSKIGQATEINVDIAERGNLWCLACIGKTAFVATRGLQSGRGEIASAYLMPQV